MKKIICLGKNYKDFYHKTKTWIPAYNGTKYKYLESIVEYGLKIPGTKLPNGLKTQKPIYIPLNDNVSGIKNWESAIFVSPSINYALDPRYSEIIDNISKDDKYNIIVGVRIRPNSFTKHKSKIIIENFPFHPDIDGNVEDIYRISSEKDIIATSINFIKYKFLGFELSKEVEEFNIN